FAEAGIPCYTSMPSCARAIRALVDYAQFQARRSRPAPTLPSPASGGGLGRGPADLRSEVARALSSSGPVLTENEAKALLARYGVRRPVETLAANVEMAIAAAARIGGPVALKVQSPDITHKTEAGGIALGISGEKAVRDAYGRILASARAAHPEAAVDGV